MPKEKPLELPAFALDWIDELKLPDEAKAVVRERLGGWVGTAEEKTKALHRGMTEAQQAAAELRRQEEEARRAADEARRRSDQWDRWLKDGNEQYAAHWNELKPIFDQYGVEGLVARLQQRGGGSPAAPQQAAAEVQDAFAAGEISWEQAQGLLRDINKRVQQMTEVQKWYAEQRPRDYKRFEDALTQMPVQLSEAINLRIQSILPIIADSIEYARNYSGKDYSDRKISDVWKVMGEKGLRNFEEGVRALYGEDDLETRIATERAAAVKEAEEKFAAERENLRREKEGRGGEGEGGVPPVSSSYVYQRRTFQDKQQEGDRRPQTPAEFQSRILEKLERGEYEKPPA
jgi:hypothetical protein